MNLCDWTYSWRACGRFVVNGIFFVQLKWVDQSGKDAGFAGRRPRIPAGARPSRVPQAPS